jgi:UDP-N-acetylmuramate: L-alanyl-gamma-D-glutamyl-meso-diaminopimelate ligase
MKLLILGTCGTFMAGIARIACQLGYAVTGVDEGMYSPIKDVLQTLDINLVASYDPKILDDNWDMVLVANALSRGMPIIEKLLASNLQYQSAPQWLYENVLYQRKVIAVAGTHGKTTTTSLLTFVLRELGLDVGYLVGGDAIDLPHTAELGRHEVFVIEADEYDTAFFDKQSKFMHYAPTVAIINNMEFDHADIYSSMAEIKKTFYALCNIVPPQGLLITCKQDKLLQNLVAPVTWCMQKTFAADGDYQAQAITNAGHNFILQCATQEIAVSWQLIGEYNIYNALAAFAVCDFLQLNLVKVAAAMHKFSGVKRRMQSRGKFGALNVYEDFAHHPTAIAGAVNALKSTMRTGKLIVVLQCGSRTMCSGDHSVEDLAGALVAADLVYITAGRKLDWDINQLSSLLPAPTQFVADLATIADELTAMEFVDGDYLLVLGNGNLDPLFQRIA